MVKLLKSMQVLYNFFVWLRDQLKFLFVSFAPNINETLAEIKLCRSADQEYPSSGSFGDKCLSDHRPHT